MYWNPAIDHQGIDPARLMGRGLTSAINVIRSTAVKIVGRHKRRIKIRKRLMLDYQSLRDIGVCRSDIYSLANRISDPAGKVGVDFEIDSAQELARGRSLDHAITTIQAVYGQDFGLKRL